MERNNKEEIKRNSKVKSWLFENNKIDKLLLRLSFKKRERQIISDFPHIINSFTNNFENLDEMDKFQIIQPIKTDRIEKLKRLKAIYSNC